MVIIIIIIITIVIIIIIIEYFYSAYPRQRELYRLKFTFTTLAMLHG
jgi:hypothetical protein